MDIAPSSKRLWYRWVDHCVHVKSLLSHQHTSCQHASCQHMHQHSCYQHILSTHMRSTHPRNPPFHILSTHPTILYYQPPLNTPYQTTLPTPLSTLSPTSTLHFTDLQPSQSGISRGGGNRQWGVGERGLSTARQRLFDIGRTTLQKLVRGVLQ